MFTALESALVARLKDALPQVHILTAQELGGVDEARQPTPAVHVIYNGYRVLESRPDGRVARVSQQWLAVIAVRNVRSRGTGADARQDGVALAEEVAGVLMGYQPAQAATPLRLVNAPTPGGDNGFLYLPLAFDIETILKATL